jgi:hypothetical protein
VAVDEDGAVDALDTRRGLDDRLALVPLDAGEEGGVVVLRPLAGERGRDVGPGVREAGEGVDLLLGGLDADQLVAAGEAALRGAVVDLRDLLLRGGASRRGALPRPRRW